MPGVISVSVNKTNTRRQTEVEQKDRPKDEKGAAVDPSNDAAYDISESIVERRAGPGILILGCTSQLLYKDRRAWELCAELNKDVGKSPNGVLPSPIVELCSEIAKLLQVWTDAKDWEQIRIKRVIGNSERPILLSGLGLPDRHGVEQSRILITMEEIGRRQGAILSQVKDMFHLTDREVTVVQNLLKGWTNKEIASELGVTEQTVKEHIKHIMAKTKTTTRTGILVQVLRL
jgi:DNA-binding CsgD family transcriptional regulator